MIVIKGMIELPKYCKICPAYWEMDAFGLEIKKCRILDKDLKYTISALCPIDPQCPLVDLGKEDMSWEELVEKVKKLIPKIEICGKSNEYFDIGIGDLSFWQDGEILNAEDTILDYRTPFQMYQIIKSLVGDKR